MKNYEKYADEIKKYNGGSSYCEEVIIPKVLKPLGKSCLGTSCAVCNSLTMLWLMEDCEEPKQPEVDWSKVEVDTPILVRDSEYEVWGKRYFAKYEYGLFYAWDAGATSWNANGSTSWRYAKLAETEGEE